MFSFLECNPCHNKNHHSLLRRPAVIRPLLKVKTSMSLRSIASAFAAVQRHSKLLGHKPSKSESKDVKIGQGFADSTSRELQQPNLAQGREGEQGKKEKQERKRGRRGRNKNEDEEDEEDDDMGWGPSLLEQSEGRADGGMESWGRERRGGGDMA
eukprot:763542-Hanusia_phi.AAC.2